MVAQVAEASVTTLQQNEKYNNIQQDKKSRKFTVPYLLNLGQKDKDRLLEQHETIKAACGGVNFDAPIEKELERGIRVLDSACGPGPWTLEMCNQYPKSTFYAVDVVPIYESMVDDAKYNNCTFVCADVLKPLPFPDNYFDYIHQRLIVFGVQAHSWPALIRELLRILKPGGWIELSEAPPNDIINIGPKCSVLNKCMKQGTIAKGFRISISRELEGYLLNCGATNIETRPIAIPLQHGGAHGEAWCRSTINGLYHNKVFRPMIEASFPEMKDTEYWNKYMSEVVEEFVEYKSTSLFFRYHAQKPINHSHNNTSSNEKIKKRGKRRLPLVYRLFSCSSFNN